MAMTQPIQPVLKPVRIKDLRPTQMTIGMKEVERKREAWRQRQARDGGEYLGAHMIPAVLGPKQTWWLIDNHHLARALHEEGVAQVLVNVVARLDHLPKKRFLAYLDSRNWLHPYDAEGRPCDWDAIPRHIADLADDAYRSLAGEVRRAGGYAKSSTPYTEFLWADFFRDRIKPARLEHHWDKAMAKALVLARGKAARYLPGFSGPEEPSDEIVD
jgi:hypothetical protein